MNKKQFKNLTITITHWKTFINVRGWGDINQGNIRDFSLHKEITFDYFHMNKEEFPKRLIEMGFKLTGFKDHGLYSMFMISSGEIESLSKKDMSSLKDLGVNFVEHVKTIENEN